MSIDPSKFFRQAPNAASCMTGWQAWQPDAGLRWWGAQLEWPSAETGLAPLADWMMQCWNAPLSFMNASLQAWSGIWQVQSPKEAVVPVEVAAPVVVTLRSPAGAPVSIELVEVRLQQPQDEDVEVVPTEPVAAAPVVDPVIEPAHEPVSEPVPEPVAAPTGRVSLNQASEADLIALKGIGPAMARQIIAQRPFASIDALVDIKGIGPKLVAQLRDQLTL